MTKEAEEPLPMHRDTREAVLVEDLTDEELKLLEEYEPPEDPELDSLMD